MIPKILHQIWKDRAVPRAYRRYRMRWRQQHPGWEFKLWTDADLADFVAARCPDFAELYHSYPRPIMRADLARYLILREYGGVYADLDTEPLASFASLVGSQRPVFAREPQSHAALEFVRSRGFCSLVSNAIIVSPAHHPFWDHLLPWLRRCRHAGNPLDATGPFVLSASIEQAPAAIAPDVLPAHVFSAYDKFGAAVARDQSQQQTLAVHHWAGTWWRPQHTPRAFYRSFKTWLRSKLLPGPTAPGMRYSASGARGEDAAAAAAETDRFFKSIDRAAIGAGHSKGRNVLIAVPVRDAADTIAPLCDRILALRYPREHLSIAFLEGDSEDDTPQRLDAFAQRHAGDFRRIDVIRHDLGMKRPGVRWLPELQRMRRSQIARARNELLRRALRDEDWVLWVDADIIGFPDDILTTLLSIGAPIVHPNAVRDPAGRSMDLNAWTSERNTPPEAMRRWILDGLYQPPAGFERLYLSDLRYRDVVTLQSVGGTMLLVDADLHRAGLLFPEQPYRHLIETEGFAAAACDLGIAPIGLPNLEIIHAPR